MDENGRDDLIRPLAFPMGSAAEIRGCPVVQSGSSKNVQDEKTGGFYDFRGFSWIDEGPPAFLIWNFRTG